MTGPDDRLTTAMQRLRAAVRDRMTAVPAPAVRARAARQLRVRRTTASVAAAAAVAALAIGGAQVAGNLAGPLPVEPAGPPASTPSPSGPSPASLDDPITEVDWFHATITLPPMDGCPSGTVDFDPRLDGTSVTNAQVDRLPNLAIVAREVAYGDLTGDGRAEAVVGAFCHGEDYGTSNFEGVLVVSRDSDGSLVGLEYVGPRAGSTELSGWIEDGTLLMHGSWSVGLALAYRWDGERFVGGQAAEQYPPMVPEAEGEPGPPVRPRAVAAALGCPDEELRFRRDAETGDDTAVASGATFVLSRRQADQTLYDLDDTGQRLLVTPFACTGPDGRTREGVAVFERAGEGWQGISLAPPPDGYGTATVPNKVYWDIYDADRPHTLAVTWRPADYPTSLDGDVRYRWTGTELVPES